ncbi:MAG: hypothetical protein NTT76_13425, partial [Achromobacter xylosoxidans]|nr:hypothetical protein [Achromobacter xylosoxidans]
MNAATPRRRSLLGKVLVILLAAAVLLAVLAWVGTRVAERRIAGLLGPRAQVGEVRLGFKEVVLTDVRIAGAAGMAPASARRVVAEPEWRSLLGQVAVFRRITVQGFDFAVLRGAAGAISMSAPAPRSTAKSQPCTGMRPPPAACPTTERPSG